MTKFSDNIIGKIKDDKIVPLPKWRFLLKKCVLWTFFFISVFLGSLSFSVIVDCAKSGDWDLISHVNGPLLTSAVLLLPFAWGIFLLLFGFVAYYNWKHTRLGYRFKRRWIFLGSIALSIVFGSIFFNLGWGRKVDNVIVKALPIYNKSKHKARLEIWQQPEQGLLIGRIIDTDEDKKFLIVQDGKGTLWEVGDSDIVSLPKNNLKDIDNKGNIVKVIGRKFGEKQFIAKDIRKCGDCDGNSDDYGGEDEDSDDN